MENKETAVEWLLRMLYSPVCVGFIQGRRNIPHDIIQRAKQMEKEQAMDLISNACMFQSAAQHDEEIGKMTHKDVYINYYNETYNKQENNE